MKWLNLTVQAMQLGCAYSPDHQASHQFAGVFHDLHIGRVFSMKTLEFQNFKTCFGQYFPVGGRTFQTGQGVRFTDWLDVPFVFRVGQAVARHPVCRHDFSRWLQNAVDFTQEIAPVDVVAGAFDVEDHIDGVIGERQMLGTIGVLKGGQVFKTGFSGFPGGDFKMQGDDIHPGDPAAS